MKYKQTLQQANNRNRLAGRVQAQIALAATLVAVGANVPGQGLTGTADPATTRSPLQILQQAPKVRLDDPAPTPAGYVPSASPPASAQPLRPTPYYPQDTPSRFESPERAERPARPRPTAPVPADEQDEAAPRDGMMKGAIRAIPFIGKRIVGPKPTPEDTPELSTHDSSMEFEPPARSPAFEAAPEVAPAYPTKAPALDLSGVEDLSPATAPTPNVPVLTVKSADSTATVQSTPPSATPSAPASAAPAVITPSATRTPAAVMPGASSPVISTPAPATPVATAPPATATKVPALSPADAGLSTTPLSSASAPTTTALASAVASTSPTLEPTDLGMPNPAYEQNEVIRREYVEAVEKGRSGNYAEAAQLFRDYAENHPSSGLAPRAFFLAALLAPDPEQSRQAATALRERFPKHRFVTELEKRKPSVATAAATPPPGEMPAQTAARLESELTDAVGTPQREVPLRLQLGQTYLTLEEFDRALEVLRPAMDLARGTAEEADILILISESYLANRDLQRAATMLTDVLERFPEAQQRPRAMYNLALVYEAGRQYERARALYSQVRLQWPDRPEAAQAMQRLKDMDRLAE